MTYWSARAEGGGVKKTFKFQIVLILVNEVVQYA
jgi:hypothetical protein